MELNIATMSKFFNHVQIVLQWYNDDHAPIECSRSYVWAQAICQPKDYDIKNAALRYKNKY